MKNKILILHETAQDSRDLSQKIFDHLAERWDMEPMLFGQDFSRIGTGVGRFAWNTASRWVPGKNMKRATQSKMLAAEESAVLAKLRQVQPPMVIATSFRTAIIMCSIKRKNFYLGQLALALPNLSYSDFATFGADFFICLNRLQTVSL
jgi:hypothetical protein